MTWQTAFVFGLTATAGLLMASNRVRFDLVALLVMLSLIVSGILSVGEALSGFGSSVVIMVAGLLVVGEMLDRTGVARAVGDWILRRGGSNEKLLLVLIMVSASVLGSAMSSTAVVAIFIPIVLRIAANTGLSKSRLLMPMAYAALISGMLTLIATPPNLVVSGELAAHGFQPLGFFSFTPIGVAVLSVAILYILLIGRFFLPGDAKPSAGDERQRTMRELWAQFRMDEQVATLRIGAESRLAGMTLAESRLDSDYTIRVLARIRPTRFGKPQITVVSPGLELTPGDLILVTGNAEDYQRVIDECGLIRHLPTQAERQTWLWEIGAASVLIHPDSRLIGQTVVDAAFRTRYGLQVLGLLSTGGPVGDFKTEKLGAGDRLLVVGPWRKISALMGRNHDFVVLEVPSEHADIVPSYRKAPVALAIVAAMVGLALFNVVPLVVAVLLAAIAAIATGCLSAENAYRAINLSGLVLVAGMLPLADALESTGGSRLIVDGLLDAVGYAEPRIMMLLLFLLTAVLGLVLSNTASAVLVAPIAITAASVLGVSPYPFAIAVLIAASAAFSTPISTPVVTLVVAPGRYGFMHFVKVGVPLMLLTCAITVLVAPLIFPFAPN